jgi:hypothetical protein
VLLLQRLLLQRLLPGGSGQRPPLPGLHHLQQLQLPGGGARRPALQHRRELLQRGCKLLFGAGGGGVGRLVAVQVQVPAPQLRRKPGGAAAAAFLLLLLLLLLLLRQPNAAVAYPRELIAACCGLENDQQHQYDVSRGLPPPGHAPLRGISFAW